ncbi:MAG: hypothetical protein ACRD4B_02395, partial [Acidobacteriota bacterium]
GTIESTYLDTSTNIVNLAASTALQFNGTTVINASRQLSNIAGVTTDLIPTAANTYSLGTGTGNQYANIYGQAIYQDGNQVCDSSGNCAGGAGGSKWQLNSGVLAPLTASNQVVLGGNTATDFQLEVNGAQAGKALVSFNETGDQDILTASASGTTRLRLTNSGNLDIIGGSYQIGGSSVLNSTTLGTSVVNSSLQTLGTINTGVWNGTTIGTGYGGTGVTGTPTNGQLLIGNGSGYTLAGLTAGTGISVSNGSGSITLNNTGVTSLAGTSNQVNVSAGTGAVTLSLPQNIHSGATPSFAALNLTNNTNQLILGTSNTGTFTLASLTGSHTYTLPDATGDVCLTSGNCAGVGGNGDIT